MSLDSLVNTVWYFNNTIDFSSIGEIPLNNTGIKIYFDFESNGVDYRYFRFLNDFNESSPSVSINKRLNYGITEDYTGNPTAYSINSFEREGAQHPAGWQNAGYMQITIKSNPTSSSDYNKLYEFLEDNATLISVLETIKIPAIMGKVTHIGRAGEHLTTTVTFDVSEWIQTFGLTGTFLLFVQQGGEEYYVQSIEQPTPQNPYVQWHVTNSNTSIVGLGKCELQYTIKKQVIKSVIYDIIVTNSIDEEAAREVPSPYESWLIEMGEMVDDIARAKECAEISEAYAKGTVDGEPVESGQIGYHNNAKYYAERIQNLSIGNVEPGQIPSDAAVTVEEGETGPILNFVLPKGDTGPRGPRGTVWYAGTNISGVPSEPMIYPQSGITSAAENDQYLNTDSGNTYQCVFAGTAAEAQWIYTGNIKGPRGPQGNGLQIYGQVEFIEDLPTASQSNLGQAYGVGSTHPYNIFVSDGTTWNNFGPISGVYATLTKWYSTVVN